MHVFLRRYLSHISVFVFITLKTATRFHSSSNQLLPPLSLSHASHTQAHTRHGDSVYYEEVILLPHDAPERISRTCASVITSVLDGNLMPVALRNVFASELILSVVFTLSPAPNTALLRLKWKIDFHATQKITPLRFEAPLYACPCRVNSDNSSLSLGSLVSAATDDLLKIQQQREKLNIFCVAVKRFRRYARESCTCAVLYCTILYSYQLLYANIDILV